jgi:S-formylglutathione hydrolase FrmB
MEGGGDENLELLSFSLYVDSIVEECSIEHPLIVFPSDQNGLYLLDENKHVASGLLSMLSKRFPVSSSEKRIVAGFSIDGAAATRTGIVSPDSYAASVSWAGGLWPNDTYLFDAVERNARILADHNFTAHIFIGGEDSPELYNPLISLFDEYEVSYNRVLLEGQKHNLGKYLERTRDEFKSVMCSVFR